MVKVNFDRTFDKGSSASCSGLVARDSLGRILLYQAIFKTNIGSAFAAEAIACQSAMEKCAEMNGERQ